MITPIILCGGSGTRLWPLSRKNYPKQFSRLLGQQTLFQASVLRVSGANYNPPIILTSSDFRFIVTEQLAEIGVDPGAVLIEPDGRNTAPAILVAALYLLEQDSQATMLVLPSDHKVPDVDQFEKTMQQGSLTCGSGDIVTFGIKPDRPETGYGYLELASSEENVSKLTRFVEKPDLVTAQQMLDAGNYMWNAGIFLFQAKRIVEEFRTQKPAMIDPATRAISEAKADLGFLRLASEPWSQIENVSIDYAVMENAENISAVRFGGHWSDLGDWESVWRESLSPSESVVTSGQSHAIDCSDSLLRSESEDQQLIGIGLENIIAVAMPDAVLVADKSRAQDVKLAVELLKEKDISQAEQFPTDHRPWGSFECLCMDKQFQVKRIIVKPGGILSLQSHVHRSEHWIVVEGVAKVTIGKEVKLIEQNQSVYIPVGEKHRLENPSDVPMVLIEVQTGSYLGEDDITRYEDVYARV